MKKQQGLALVLVLWVLSLLIIMAGSFALSMRRETAIISGIKESSEALSLAEAGLNLAQFMLINADPEKIWYADGRIYELNYNHASIRIRILSEKGKIDVNKADEALLQQLMIQAPIDDEQKVSLIDAIIDWRDQDEIVRNAGAEKDEYEAAGLKYHPRNASFRSLEEVRMVLGMNETLIKWLEPLITIYSGQAQVDKKKASREVLKILNGMNPIDSAGGILENRNAQSPGQIPFSDFNELDSQPQALSFDEVVTIIAEAKLVEGNTATLKATVKRALEGSRPYQILNWEPNYNGPISLFSDAMDELLETENGEP